MCSFMNDRRLLEGTSVKICCHCNSQRCIVPFEVRGELSDEPWNAKGQSWELEEVSVRFMQTPASPQAVQPYTVLFTWHAATPEQVAK